MPRKPSVILPLRSVREAAQLTHQQLAERLGVTRHTVEKLENDRLAMSHEIAVKLRHQLGCEIVMKPDSKTGRERWGISDKKHRAGRRRTKYTENDYLQHQEILAGMRDGDPGQWEEGLSQALRLVIGAARRARVLPAVTHDMELALTTLIGVYKLERHIGTVLREDHGMSRGDAQQTVKKLAVTPTVTGLGIGERE